jgi:hypothetical protein
MATATQREQWIARNNSRSALSLGIIGMPIIRPGKSADILFYTSKEDAAQSLDLKQLLELKYISIQIIRDGTLLDTVTDANVTDLGNEDSSAANDVIDPVNNTVELAQYTIDLDGGTMMVGGGGKIYVGGGDIYLGFGAGVSGGDIGMDMGNIRHANLVETSVLRANNVYDAQGEYGFQFVGGTIVPTTTIDISDEKLLVGDEGQINFIGSTMDGMAVFTSGTISSTTTYWNRDTLAINTKYINCYSAQMIRLRANNLAKAPNNPQPGEMYFDTVMKKLRCFDGTDWQNAW